MSYPVSYYCPRCGTLVELDRDGYLADKSVTPYPLDGWTYVPPDEPFEEDADGVRFVCGESEGVVWDPHDGVRGTDVSGTDRSADDVSDDATAREDDVAREDGAARDDATAREDGAARDGPGCGEPFYLSFVRYEEGREIEPRAETELVEIEPDPRPRGPRGPGGPSGPSGSDGGFW